MDFLRHVIGSPPDPILGINLAFAADPRSEKLNASVGTYRQDDLRPCIFPSVKAAEQIVLEEEQDKEYLPIAGDAGYIAATQKLVLGPQELPHVCGLQTVGGTGALRLIAEVLHHAGLRTCYIGDPTWGNHAPIFTTVGFEVRYFPYFDAQLQGIHFGKVHESLSKMEPGSVLLLQTSCHNPTGCDFSEQQWHAVLELVKQRQIFVIFDLAYQGFGINLEEDVYPIRLFLQHHVVCAVAVSHSKTFGLYAERVGALYMACIHQQQAETVLSRLKVIARRAYSNPPCHGVRIIRTILQSASLKGQWRQELEQVRHRISQMRHLLVQELSHQLGNDPQSLAYVLEQKGMFAFAGISPGQVEMLKQQHGIYLTGDGRINLAGLNAQAIEHLTRALAGCQV